MHSSTRTRIAAAALAAAALLAGREAAALNLGTQPLYLGGSIAPVVMLTVPKDHQLFKKAYDDYSDLDSTLPGGDTALETTYKHSIDYYGYFDPYKCYDYVNANLRFEAAANTTNKKCTAKWSGNFLNWVSMSRLDIMRKLFYGGYRSTDTGADASPGPVVADVTVLERAGVPTDGHSWTKHFRGNALASVAEVTPFSTALTAARTYTSPDDHTIASSGTKALTVNNPSNVVHPLLNGDQVTLCHSTNANRCMYGRVTGEQFGATALVTFTIDGSIGSGTVSNWIITNLSSPGITICNATTATTGDTQTTTAPPLMRVVAGDYTMWSSGDAGACRWNDEAGSANGNLYFFSEIASNSNSPFRAGTPSTHLNVSSVTTGDYVVRVVACPSSPLTMIGTERCTQYPNGNWKPTGLLQDYAAGQQKKIKFGLMSGSYNKNKSGGVLRKNASFLDSATSASPSLYVATVDEIDADSGRFNTTAGVHGIIRTMNSLRLYGYGFASKKFDSNDGCGSASAMNVAEPGCSSFGNPISEMYVETLRYLAGKAVETTGANVFDYTDAGSKDAQLGLTKPAWTNPVTSATYCTPLNIVALNSSVNSYDNDQFTTDLFAAGTTAQSLTKLVGDHEGITGGAYFVGNNGTINNGKCTSKTIPDFGLATGVCPEAPALSGSFRIAGAAHWAKTNRIRSDLTLPATDTRSLKVTTYGIALASGAPTIQIPVPGSSPTRYVTILPAFRVFSGTLGELSGGQLVDFKVIRQDHAAGTGKFWVAWDDTEAGNDYDLDVSGTISYQFTSANSRLVVTTDVITGSAGFSHGFGFVISGTSAVSLDAASAPTIAPGDGMHFYSGFKGGQNAVVSHHYPTGFNTTTTGNNQCNDCALADPPASRTFTVSASTASVLKDPLWYASKYGGFVDQNANNRPDLLSEWDSRVNVSGADGADGNPDTYFPVTNPAGLEIALDRAFVAVLQTSSASSVATNSTSLQSGSIVYQARFNSNEWSGQLLAFSISTTGAIDPVPLWDAGQLLPASTARTIVTFNRSTADPSQAGTPKGIPFRWANVSLNSGYTTDLNKNGLGTADAAGTNCTAATSTSFTPAGCTKQGPLRLDWLRGDPTNEGATATKYRVRPTSRLGDIVNSTPAYVGAPSILQYGDFSPPAAAYSGDATYTAFITNATYANRTPMIYAGGNGGMLHGFDAGTGSSKGVEKLAYVPSTAYRHLTKLTDKTYSHRYYVDGTPTIADVYINGAWKTILVGGMNAGGQGIYALDVSNPAQFTEANANNIVLWEFTDQNDVRLGYTYSQPTVAKMANGKWAVIFASGYNNSLPETGDTDSSSTGRARLFILFIEDGVDGVWSSGDFVTIDVNTGGSAAVPNGLATPRVVTRTSDGVAQYIYAGDLNGKLWKFDVTSASSNAWDLANGNTPLFYANDDVAPTSPYVALTAVQPITAAPTSVAHSSGTGHLILFGTGKFLEQADDSPPFTTQGFYGIWDKHDGTTVSGRSKLLRQKVLGATAANPLGTTADDAATPLVNEGGFRITTPYTPNYSAAARANTFFGEGVSNAQDEYATTPPQRGWYFDMPYSGDYGTAPVVSGTGERSVFRPIISTGKLVFTTLVPSAVSCEAGGTSFIMDLDPTTGSRLTNSPFDVDGDLNFSSADYVSDPAGNRIAVSGKASTIGLVPTPTVIQMTPSSGPGIAGKEVKVLSGSTGQLIAVIELGAAGALPGAAGRRTTWRELLAD